MNVPFKKPTSDWIVDRSLSYSLNEKDKVKSRLYAVIGADNNGRSFVKIRGFGPEYKKLIANLYKYVDSVTKIGKDIILYPKDGYSLGLLKKIALEGRKLGFRYGAEVSFRAINRAIDILADGTLMGHIPKISKRQNKIANALLKTNMVVSKLINASTAEQEAEQLLKIVLPDSPFSGKAHAVGGYVRDQLLNEMFPGKTKPPKDLDVVVEMNGGAKKITEYLHKKLKNKKGNPATHRPHLLGKGYPIWSLSFKKEDEGNVFFNNKTYFTTEAVIEFADTQKEAFPDPESRQRVTNYGTLDDDIKRRDFTVNMLIKDMTTGEIKDLTGVSKKDLKEGVLKGHPEVDLNKIFADDPLRMVRLIRFKVKYGWKIPDSVKEIVRNNIQRLNILSAERIRDELLKIIQYGKLKEAIGLAKELHMDQVSLDEKENLNPLSFLMQKLKDLDISHESVHHIDTEDKKDDKVIDHTLNVIDMAQKTVSAQLSALLHDIGKPLAKAVDENGKVSFRKHEEKGLAIAEEILKRFKLDSKTINKTLSIVKNHMRPHSLENASDKALRKFIRDMGEDLEDVLDMAEADSLGKNPPNNYIEKLRDRIEELKNAKVKTKSVLDGIEIMDILNVSGGPIVGEAKKLILEAQDEDPQLTKAEAKDIILKAYK